MKKSNKFSPEVRERAVRMVQEHKGEYLSLWAAVESIPPKIGCVPQTLLEWVKRVEVDAGVREGVTTSEAQRVKEADQRLRAARLWAHAPGSASQRHDDDAAVAGARRPAPRDVHPPVFPVLCELPHLCPKPQV